MGDSIKLRRYLDAYHLTVSGTVSPSATGLVGSFRPSLKVIGGLSGVLKEILSFWMLACAPKSVLFGFFGLRGLIHANNPKIFEGFLKFGVKNLQAPCSSCTLEYEPLGLPSSTFRKVDYIWTSYNWTVDQVKWLGTICERRLQILETSIWIHFSGIMSSTLARAKNNQKHTTMQYDSLDHVRYPKSVYHCIDISCIARPCHDKRMS